MAPDLDSQGHLWSENNAITSWSRHISTSDCFIHPYYTYIKCLSHWYVVSREYECTLIPLHWPSWPQIWEVRVTCGVKMMPQRHGWGWCLLQTASYIHIRHIQNVWDIGMLSQWHMVAPLYPYTGQVSPRFGDSGSLVEWKWCHNIIVEADIHLRPLHTSILDIHKVFETLVCCLKGIWLPPYTITPAKLPPDWVIQVLRSRNDATTSWLRLIFTSDHFIHPY